MNGLTNHLAGRAAEDCVTRHYVEAGHVVLSRRWRGRGGELDLVTEKDGTVIFVEVKKSRSFAEAAQHLSARQIGRILGSASDYLGHMPDGQNSLARIDLALVDAQGRIDILENALAA